LIGRAAFKPVESRDVESAVSQLYTSLTTELANDEMVRLYRDAGGIIFCKTNVPQASLPPESQETDGRGG
jgi:Asp-tRNA(Asn)/Glu-tRNA(Gln) amidotransferase A subunit family amidase